MSDPIRRIGKPELMALLAPCAETHRRIYGAIAAAAMEGRPCPTCDELCELTGLSAVSATVDAIHRLERLGVIHVLRYQRSRQVFLAESGLWTAAPVNTAPHWRDRPAGLRLATPGEAALRARSAGVAGEIMNWAEARGLPLSEALIDLIYVGWKVEMERA